MDLATLDEDEDILDEEPQEDPEGDEYQGKSGGIDLSQWPRHAVERLTPVTREILETGRVPAEPMDQVRGEETNETLGTPSSGRPVERSGLIAPSPWRSSVQFVQETYKEIQWLIPGILPAGAVVLLSGKAGTMKSFLALSMASAVASGIPWLGRPTKQGPALYVDGENPPSLLQDRLRGIGTSGSLNIWSLGDETFPQTLKHPDLQCAGTMHSLIVVDTLRRQMGTLDEDSSNDMAQITRNLRELTRYGATVLALHHSPKNPTKTGPRGSSELEAGCDISISLTKRKTKKAVRLTLEMTKNRYPSSDDNIEIYAMRGNKAPQFTILGADQEPATDDLHELALLVNTLRKDLGRDPNKKEIKAKAKKAGLGGRSSIDQMLDEDEGTYWRKQKDGRDTRYAPA